MFESGYKSKDLRMSCTLTQFFRMQKFQVQRLQICQQTTSIAFAYPLIKEQDERELYNQKMKENFKIKIWSRKQKQIILKHPKKCCVVSFYIANCLQLPRLVVHNNAKKACKCFQKVQCL